MSFSPSKSYRVHFAKGIYEKMLASVGKLEPEHYAILGGYLHDPHRITDFMPMPPPTDQRGRQRSSSATVTLNGPFIEYYLNTCLLPFGKYILGVMHSHPGGMNFLSDGAPGSGYGDIPSMRAHLEAAQRMGDPWHDYIAPIVTYPGATPRVDTWILNLKAPYPIRAKTVWEQANSIPTRQALPAINDEILDLLFRRPDLIAAILQRGDRLKRLAALRSHQARDARRAEMLVRRIHAQHGPFTFDQSILSNPIINELWGGNGLSHR